MGIILGFLFGSFWLKRVCLCEGLGGDVRGRVLGFTFFLFESGCDFILVSGVGWWLVVKGLRFFFF